jgi:hypothetical protein
MHDGCSYIDAMHETQALFEEKHALSGNNFVSTFGLNKCGNEG